MPFFIHFCFNNAVWALMSGGFRIVSDTLVIIIILVERSRSINFSFGVLVTYNAANLCLLSRFDKLLPKSKFCTSLKLLASMVAEVGVSTFGGVGLLLQSPPIFVLKVVLVKVNKNSLCTKFEVASFNGCRNEQDLKLFGCSHSPDGPRPRRFWP